MSAPSQSRVPPYGERVSVLPGIESVLAPNPSPFTHDGSLTFIVGDTELAIIDPGPALDEHVTATVNAVAGRRVAAILVTHTHIDHSPATVMLAPRLGFPPVYAYGPHASGTTRHVPREFGSDYDFDPDVCLADGDVVSGQGWSFEAVHTPGHASNHMCFAMRGTEILFTGDHVMGWSTTMVAPPDGDMGEYIASLRKILARPESVYVSGHGPFVPDGRSLAQKMLKRRLERREEILAEIRLGYVTVEAIFERLYVGLDPRLAMAALLTIDAHLIELKADGKL